MVATGLVGFLLAVVFLCPWRIESTGEIKWSPIYQPPMSYVRTYDSDFGAKGGSRIDSDDAKIAYDILVLEVLLIGLAGGALYLYNADSGQENGGTVSHFID